MKILMLDTITFGEDIDLSKYHTLGEVITYSQSTPQEAAQRLAAHDPDVVVVNKIVLDEQALSAAPNVKMIAETATGYNNIDLAYAQAHDIRVANVAGYSTQTVIQHTFALCFYLLEKLNYYDTYVKSGAYSKSPCFTHFAKIFPELAGKTWGIIGLGAIGRGVADIAKAFGCKVIYYSASGRKYDTVYEPVSFAELLSQSDIISVHAPLNSNTENLIDYNALCQMKPSTLLLNLGRGPIVKDADLARALEEGRIAGAGLDVMGKEPIEADNPLLRISDSSRLIITPHIAWASYEARVRLMDEVYENVKAFMEGRERNKIV